MWDVRDVGYSGCGMFGMWYVRDVGCAGCEMLGMWDVRDAGCSGCGMWHVGCWFTKCRKIGQHFQQSGPPCLHSQWKVTRARLVLGFSLVTPILPPTSGSIEYLCFSFGIIINSFICQFSLHYYWYFHNQKQSSGEVLQKWCSYIFRKINKKTLLFNKVANLQS